MIARDAVKFFLPVISATILFALVSMFSSVLIIRLLIFVLAFLTVFILYFFRDPERPLLAGPGELVSPADGKIIFVGTTEDKEIGKCNLISVFMSVLNVHVNRSPISGVVRKREHIPGKFLAAFKEQARFDNEKVVLIVQNDSLTVKVVQIAGILARRIVNYLKEGEEIEKGQKIGLIKFGSRVDIYLPEKVNITVKQGDRVTAGISVIGVTNAN